MHQLKYHNAVQNYSALLECAGSLRHAKPAIRQTFYCRYYTNMYYVNMMKEKAGTSGGVSSSGHNNSRMYGPWTF